MSLNAVVLRLRGGAVAMLKQPGKENTVTVYLYSRYTDSTIIRRQKLFQQIDDGEKI